MRRCHLRGRGAVRRVKYSCVNWLHVERRDFEGLPTVADRVQVELNMFRNSPNSPINDRRMRRIITAVILFPPPHLVPGPKLS
jgi:hypothetical protein